jgi:hypothetical protein
VEKTFGIPYNHALQNHVHSNVSLEALTLIVYHKRRRGKRGILPGSPGLMVGSLNFAYCSLAPLQELGVDLHRMLHSDPQPGLGGQIGDLEHAGGAAGGHHPAAGGGDVIPLAPADGR